MMRAAQKNALLKQAFRMLGCALQVHGWPVCKQVPKGLFVERTVSQALKVGLRFTEAHTIEPAPPNLLPVSCTLDVRFSSLSRAIREAADADFTEWDPPALWVPLRMLCDSGHLHDGMGHLIRLFRTSESDGGLDSDLQLLVDDCTECFEPLITRLADEAVFLDDDYLPPNAPHWGWQLLRLEHCRQSGDIARWNRLAARTKSALQAALATEGANSSNFSGIYTDITKLVADGERSAAWRALRYLRHGRDLAGRHTPVDKTLND